MFPFFSQVVLSRWRRWAHAACLLSSPPCRTMAAPLHHDSFNLILIKFWSDAGSRCCTRDHAGSQFGRKWLLSAASEAPRASQKFSRLSNCRKHPPAHGEMRNAWGDLTAAANNSGNKSKNDVRLQHHRNMRVKCYFLKRCRMKGRKTTVVHNKGTDTVDLL